MLQSRSTIRDAVHTFLVAFEQQQGDAKKGLFIYGNTGIGKTTFVDCVLRELGYDVIYFNAGDVRNKSVIETLSTRNVSNTNVMSLFENKIKKIAIVMDEIDGMNSGDKGGINALIKIIRKKSARPVDKQKQTTNPIICISNYHMDKKIKELMSVCTVLELSTPTKVEMQYLLEEFVPRDHTLYKYGLDYIQQDLRKLHTFRTKIFTIPLAPISFHNVLHLKRKNEDTKQIIQNLLTNKYTFKEHGTVMSDTDRTIVGLLWHENVVNVLQDQENRIPFYTSLLKSFCYSDYIDRLTFQKQIWQFNEMSSLIKTMATSHNLHKTQSSSLSTVEIRFTKVLTKYSTEYNNTQFIQHMCKEMDMNKMDLFSFFFSRPSKEKEDHIIMTTDITKLDIVRIYRYLEKYTPITVQCVLPIVSKTPKKKAGNPRTKKQCKGISGMDDAFDDSIPIVTLYHKDKDTIMEYGDNVILGNLNDDDD